MKWIYPAFKFNNGLMPQSGSASHNAPVKRKEAGATRNCHIKPIVEKWIRQICLFGVVQCHVSPKVLHMFRLEFIQNDWLHSLCFFFFSLSLFIFSMVAFVWKREAQSTIFRRLSSYYCKPSCLEGDLKFKCILSLISPPFPPFAFYDSLRQGPDQKEGEKKNPLIVKRAFWGLWEYLASCFKEQCIKEVQHERSLGLSDTRLQLQQIYHLSWLGILFSLSCSNSQSVHVLWQKYNV